MVASCRSVLRSVLRLNFQVSGIGQHDADAIKFVTGQIHGSLSSNTHSGSTFVLFLRMLLFQSLVDQ